jgi:hypothetical protein
MVYAELVAVLRKNVMVIVQIQILISVDTITHVGIKQWKAHHVHLNL